MKKSIFPLAALALLLLISCNNNSSSNTESAKKSLDNEMAIKSNNNLGNDVKTITPIFKDVNAGISSYMRSLIQNYLDIKNALVKDDEVSAADAASQFNNKMKNLDKRLFTAAQKKVYDSAEMSLKNEADSISKNKIDKQREHFYTMSKDVYSLVKAFGSGIPLYGDNCPMYHNGAMWLSEITEIKNPYLGTKMSDCGSVEEKFQ